MSQHFPMRLGRRSRPLLRLFGVRGVENAYVDVDDDGADGEVRSRRRSGVPLANIAGWRIEGPWLWITAIGIRMSVRHRDLSFAGSPRGGVRLDFKERVRFGPFRIPALYVGVEDLEGLAALLSTRGIAGIDARDRQVPRRTGVGCTRHDRPLGRRPEDAWLTLISNKNG